MTHARDERGRSGQRDQSTSRRWIALVMGLMLLLAGLGMPVPASALTELDPYCIVFTLGICAIWVHPAHFEAAPEADPTVPVNCSNPVMTGPPRFLSWPQGAAKYPFTARCTNPARPGTMNVTWEGSWTPSETRRDRPNASETLTITGYEPFIPGRAPGGKIFMYWTASCNADPWLQGGACSRFGAYVPDDLRMAFPDMDNLSFPRTANQMSPSLRQQLFVEYQRVNSQIAMSPGTRQNLQATILQQQSQAMITQQPKQAQSMIVVPQATTPKPDTTMGSIVARPNILLRGVEPTEPQQSGQQPEEAQQASAETSAMAVLEEGTPEIAEPVALMLDRPLHVMTAKGDAVELKPGVYEIGVVLDVQLGLAKEGQPTVLLHAQRGTYSESITRAMALVIPGQSNVDHLVLLTPDGRRFDAVGFTSEVKSRSTDTVASLPDRKITDAIAAASTKTGSVPLPPCKPNPAEIGPRWIPVPCTMPTIPAPAPTP